MDNFDRLTIPYSREYLLSMIAESYSPTTIVSKVLAFDYLQAFLEDRGITFDQLTPALVTEFKASLLDPRRSSPQGYRKAPKPLTTNFINQVLMHLRAFLKWLLAMDYPYPLHPEKIRLARRERKKSQIPPFAQVQQLLEIPSKIEPKKEIALRNRAILETLFATGMRISELVKLNVDQLEGEHILIEGKGRKERFAYLTPRARHFIDRYLGVRKNVSPALFTPINGGERLSDNRVFYALKKYSKVAGLKSSITPHTLRHAFATLLSEKGANPVDIQTLLGHESLATTSIYIHPSDKLAQQAHTRYHPLAGLTRSTKPEREKAPLPLSFPPRGSHRGRPSKKRKRGRPQKGKALLR